MQAIAKQKMNTLNMKQPREKGKKTNTQQKIIIISSSNSIMIAWGWHRLCVILFFALHLLIFCGCSNYVFFFFKFRSKPQQ